MLSSQQKVPGRPQIAATAGLFSAAVVQELARCGQSALFGRLLHESMPGVQPNPTATVASLFDAAFQTLKRKAHRHEYVYKSAIAERILLGRHNLNTAVMLTEFRAGSRKADVTIINGTSTAYEIKSERDRLDRLTDQLDTYLRVFAQVYVVTGENHLDGVLRLAPKDVGVLLLTDRYQMSKVRKAVDDPERIDLGLLFESLRGSEIRRILTLNDVSIPRVPNTRERRALRAEFLRLKSAEIHSAMVQTLRQTRGQLNLNRLIQAAPRSLWAAICATPIRKQDHPRLLGALTTSASKALAWH